MSIFGSFNLFGNSLQNSPKQETFSYSKASQIMKTSQEEYVKELGEALQKNRQGMIREINELREIHISKCKNLSSIIFKT